MALDANRSVGRQYRALQTGGLPAGLGMFFRSSLIAAAVWAAVGGPALALSCMPPDVNRMWTEAAKSDASYVVATGTLSFDASRLPKTDWDDQAATPALTQIPARFKGKGLTRGGFTSSMQMRVVMDVQCFGPWCAGVSPDTLYLLFLRKDADGYHAVFDPCGGLAMGSPPAELQKHLTACMNGADCRPQPLQ